MNNIIEIRENELYIATNIIADKLNREHRSIYKLVYTYKKQLEMFGVLRFEIIPNKEKNGGGTRKIYYLNEKQYIFLITNMRTKADEIDTVMEAKMQIANQFVDMKRALLGIEVNKKNKEWLEAREQGKITRKETTGVYKEYLEYAIEQGSKNYKKMPENVYINFTKMINKALFDFEFKIPKGDSARNYMTTNQLTITSTAELAAQRLIHREIDNGTHYKEIYQIVKKEMEQYSKFIGKSTIIDLLTSNSMEQKLLS